MKLAKLFAYLGISIFIPLWLFILMDTKLEKDYEGKSLFSGFNNLLKIQKDNGEANPETTTTINQPFIQFTYSPQTTSLMHPKDKRGAPESFPETIKIDPETFSGVVDELESLKDNVSSDIQSIKSTLYVLNSNQNDRNESIKDNTNVFRYEFSEKDMPVWVVTRNYISDQSILIMRNKSKIFNADLKFNLRELKISEGGKTDTIVTLKPNEEIALLIDSNNSKIRKYFITVRFKHSNLTLFNTDTNRITIIMNNKLPQY